MGKGKLAKFADMETYENVFQYPYSSTLWSKCGTQSVVDNILSPKGESVARIPFEMQGHWREQYFHNYNPIVLELGCGKGEYTVGLAKLFPDVNFIGVDIKGARMWTGATQALQEGLKNVAFLRTNIEIIDRFFAAGEVQEIWLTFSDPQMKNPRKRLTSTWFLNRYRHFLSDGGFIHLKTDSNFLFTYTSCLVDANHLPVLVKTTDLYATASKDSIAASIQTYYESMWIARGISIKYLKFCLPRDGELVEPDVEIELDDYRSYHRDKRSPKEKAK